MKEKIYKAFLIVMVSLSLGLGLIAKNEICRMPESFSGTGSTQVQELDEASKQL